MAKFKIVANSKGEYFWKLVADNGEPVCWTEGYSSKSAAKEAAEWVKKNAPKAEVVEE
jgi:uncharacterized protein